MDGGIDLETMPCVEDGSYNNYCTTPRNKKAENQKPVTHGTKTVLSLCAIGTSPRDFVCHAAEKIRIEKQNELEKQLGHKHDRE